MHQTFTAQEVSFMLGIASDANPDEYDDERVKAVIYKARGSISRNPDGTRTVSPWTVVHENAYGL